MQDRFDFPNASERLPALGARFRAVADSAPIIIWVNGLSFSLLFTWQAALFGLLVVLAVLRARGLSAPLRALWHDGRGDWKRAHEIVQEENGKTAARVHAYLHRKEGDASNAGYWYRRAGKTPAVEPLADEWEALARAILTEG